MKIIKFIFVFFLFLTIAINIFSRINKTYAYTPPEDCDTTADCLCGPPGVGQTCQSHYCRPGDHPCSTPTRPPQQPTPTPVPGGGPTPTSGGSTPTPSGPTPTPQCTANCSGETCADVAGTSCTNDDHCTSPYKCNTSTHQCQLCTTPGKSCCYYCVPQGFGCDWNPCPLCKSCKKYRCLGVQPDVCSSNQFDVETLIPCAQACEGVPCGGITCGVDVGRCFWDCDVGPNCQPLGSLPTRGAHPVG